MGIPLWETREYAFGSYLNRVRKVIEDHYLKPPNVSQTSMEAVSWWSWWDRAMRKTFGDSDVYLGDTGRWRRIEYMLNELLGKIDADVTVSFGCACS